MSNPESSEEVTIERAVEILLAQVEQLDARLSRMEEFIAHAFSIPTPTVAADNRPPDDVAQQPRHRRYRADPFHGLFGYYFVLGILLLAFLGVVLALASRDSITLIWWVSAAALTVYQMVFVTLGAVYRDRHTLMNATVGLMISVLIDIGVIRLVPFPWVFSS